MYRCDSWTIEKAECWRVDALRVPGTARRSNQSILEEINLEYSLEGLLLKLKLWYFGHLMWRVDTQGKTLILGKIEGNRRRGQQRMRCLDSITDPMDMSLSELWKIVEDRGAWHATVLGVMKIRTWLSNWTTITKTHPRGQSMLLKLLPSSLPIKWSVSTSPARGEHRPIVSLQIPPVHTLAASQAVQTCVGSRQLSADTALHLLSFPRVDTWPSSERVNPYDKDACQGGVVVPKPLFLRTWPRNTVLSFIRDVELCQPL